MPIVSKETNERISLSQEYELDKDSGLVISDQDTALEDNIRHGRQGYIFIVGSSVCQALVTFFVHVAETTYGYPTASAVIVRAFTSILLPSLYLSLNRSVFDTHLSPRVVAMLATRGIAGGASAFLSFGALGRLPVGTAVTLFYASPAITTILSAIFLTDPLTCMLMLTVMTNFAGVAMVSQPTGEGTHWVGVAFALGMAFASSIVFVLQRAMGLRVHFVLGVLAYGVGCALIAAVTADLFDVRSLFNNASGTFFALCSGLAGFGSQSFLNKGLQRVPAGPAIVVRSLNVPITFLLGLWFLGERPSVLSLFGVAIVLGSVAGIGYLQLIRK